MRTLLSWKLFAAVLVTVFLMSKQGIVSQTSASENVEITDSIEISMTNVDDVGYVIVGNIKAKKPFTIVAKCQWRSFLSPGSVRKNINKHLKLGTNYIIFVIYNKVYNGGVYFPGGKWSGNMNLFKNGVSVWHQDKLVRGNKRGLKYWEVIKANVAKNGIVSISEKIPGKIKDHLSSYKKKFEINLNASADEITPF